MRPLGHTAGMTNFLIPTLWLSLFGDEGSEQLSTNLPSKNDANVALWLEGRGQHEDLTGVQRVPPDTPSRDTVVQSRSAPVTDSWLGGATYYNGTMRHGMRE
jgi:hypothetical protein